jgi:hypothetical protein
MTALNKSVQKDSSDRRAEFAGGEVIQGAQAAGEFGGVQAALAVEPAKKIIGELFSFLRVALRGRVRAAAVRGTVSGRAFLPRNTGPGTRITCRLATLGARA